MVRATVDAGFPGHCRVRRAEIMRLRGAFTRRRTKLARRSRSDRVRRVADRRRGLPRDRGDPAADRRSGRCRGSVRAGPSARQRCSAGAAMLQLARGRTSRHARRSARRSLTSRCRSSGPTVPRRSRSRLRLTTWRRRARRPRSSRDRLDLRRASCGTRAPIKRSAPSLTYEGDARGAIAELRRGRPSVDRGGPSFRAGAGAPMARARPTGRRGQDRPPWSCERPSRRSSGWAQRSKPSDATR